MILKKKINGFLFRLFDKVNPLFFSFIGCFFRLINTILKRKKILIFTDSRGYEVTRPWNRGNPFSSYAGFFLKRYVCDISLCPEKFTSLLDFIEFHDAKKCDYDLVILHCGIVDFAPRPISSYESMLSSKRNIIRRYSLDTYFDNKPDYDKTLYEGEKTVSFFSDKIIEEFVVEKLSQINNLIYIGTNRVLMDWQGNYWRKRPENINIQMELNELLQKKLNLVVDLSSLSDADIRKYTTDNVHYNKDGFGYILSSLISCLK